MSDGLSAALISDDSENCSQGITKGPALLQHASGEDRAKKKKKKAHRLHQLKDLQAWLCFRCIGPNEWGYSLVLNPN